MLCGDPCKVTDGSLANTTKWFISPEPTPGMDHQVFFRLQDTVRTTSPARGRVVTYIEQLDPPFDQAK